MKDFECNKIFGKKKYLRKNLVHKNEGPLSPKGLVKVRSVTTQNFSFLAGVEITRPNLRSLVGLEVTVKFVVFDGG